MIINNNKNNNNNRFNRINRMPAYQYSRRGFLSVFLAACCVKTGTIAALIKLPAIVATIATGTEVVSLVTTGALYYLTFDDLILLWSAGIQWSIVDLLFALFIYEYPEEVIVNTIDSLASSSGNISSNIENITNAETEEELSVFTATEKKQAASVAGGLALIGIFIILITAAR